MEATSGGRAAGKTQAMIQESVDKLRNGEGVALLCGSERAANTIYDRMLTALQADEHLIVESNQRSRKMIYVYSAVYGALTFHVGVLVETKGKAQDF